MAETNRITFKECELKGSRLRCLLVTNQKNDDVANFFTNLVAPHATANAEARWFPQGLLRPDEAKLGQTHGLLEDDQRTTLRQWWLARQGRANTPNWDLVCKARFGDGAGLILVEAKAHEGELGDDRCGATNRENHVRITAAMREANDGLNQLVGGFHLSPESYYQLGNRFAFAWKLAMMGVPTVLVYLGFLNAHEMDNRGRSILRSHDQWRRCVERQTSNIVPTTIWGTTHQIGDTPLTVLIRSAEVRIVAAQCATEVCDVVH